MPASWCRQRRLCHSYLTAATFCILTETWAHNARAVDFSISFSPLWSSQRDLCMHCRSRGFDTCLNADGDLSAVCAGAANLAAASFVEDILVHPLEEWQMQQRGQLQPRTWRVRAAQGRYRGTRPCHHTGKGPWISYHAVTLLEEIYMSMFCHSGDRSASSCCIARNPVSLHTCSQYP